LCLNLRIADIETMRLQVIVCQTSQDQIKAKINWQFITEAALSKLKRLYPAFGD